MGGLFGAYLGAPAKTMPSGSGAIVMNLFIRNPPSPALTFAAVDWHPWRYDETTFAPTWQERLRGIIGVAITPNAGPVVGVGFGLLRGVSIEAGAVTTFQAYTRPRSIHGVDCSEGSS